MLTRSARVFVGAVLLVALALTGACNKPKQRVLTKEQKEQIRAHLLKEAPKLDVRLDADLDGHITLLGVTFSKKEVKAGETVDITYYWKCEKELKGGWMIFGHLENATPPTQKRQILDHHPMGQLYPITQWKAGEIIEDVQNLRLDSDWPSGTATLWIGVFDEQKWKESEQNDRLRLLNPDKVPNDGDNRIRVGTLKVIGKKGAKGAGKRFVRSYSAVKVSEPMTIDGKLDEPAWRLARPTQPFVQPDGKPFDRRHQARARLLWDDKNLYVAFDVKDDDIWNPKTGRDDPLWEQDVVEVYLDPGEDGRDYVELQFSPTGALFDAWFDSHRRPKWELASKRFNIAIESAVHLDGSVNKRDDGVTDRAWTVEAAIPFAELPKLSGPPKAGARWKLNLYRIDSKGPRQMTSQGAWAPAGGDFHNLAGAGTLVFGGTRPAVLHPTVPHPTVPHPTKVMPGGTVRVPTVMPKAAVQKPLPGKPIAAKPAPAKPVAGEPAPAKPAPAKAAPSKP